MKQRFDRFAVLERWSFQEPTHCRFAIETLKEQGDKVPDAIEACIAKDLFIPEEFEAVVQAAAEAHENAGKLLRELAEPRPKEEACIPWLGETLMKERLVRLCARGKVAINVRGTEYLQALPGEDEETAWARMKGRSLGTGKHLDDCIVLPPHAVPVAKRALGEPKPDGGEDGANNAGGAVAGAGAGISGCGGSVFPPPSEKAEAVPLVSAATSALNLLGKLEAWGVGPATSLRTIELEFPRATGAQLVKLLKEMVRQLPDGPDYELRLEKEQS